MPDFVVLSRRDVVLTLHNVMCTIHVNPGYLEGFNGTSRKSAWASLLGITVVFVPYFLIVFWAPPAFMGFLPVATVILSVLAGRLSHRQRDHDSFRSQERRCSSAGRA